MASPAMRAFLFLLLVRFAPRASRPAEPAQDASDARFADEADPAAEGAEARVAAQEPRGGRDEEPDRSDAYRRGDAHVLRAAKRSAEHDVHGVEHLERGGHEEQPPRD